jgi:hypothetical protein
MEVSTVKGFSYKEYRHPTLERMIIWGVHATNFLSVVGSVCFLKLVLGWPVAVLFAITYDMLRRMKSHSIYCYDDKGFGPGLFVIAVEDFVHAVRYMCFAVVLALIISGPVNHKLKSIYNIQEVHHESNTEGRNDQIGEMPADSSVPNN